MKPWHDLQESEVRRNYNTTSFLFAAQGSTFYNVVLPRSKLVYIFPSNYVAIACTDHESLVGGLEHEFSDFPYIGNVIIPTDGLIFFRGVETTKQIIFGHSEAVTSSPHGTF